MLRQIAIPFGLRDDVVGVSIDPFRSSRNLKILHMIRRGEHPLQRHVLRREPTSGAGNDGKSAKTGRRMLNRRDLKSLRQSDRHHHRQKTHLHTFN